MNRLHLPHGVKRGFRQALRLFGWFMAAWLATAAAGRGQSIWEVTPYRIEVWVTFQPHPRVDPQWAQQLPQEIQQLAESRVGAVWRLQAQTPPAEFLGDLMGNVQLNLEPLRQQNYLGDVDKLVVLSVRDHADGYRLSAREADLLTRQWSTTQSITVADGANLGLQALKLICDVFTPMVRIERIEGATVTAAIRGGALVRPEQSPRYWQVPSQIQAGDVLQPILVKTDRNGAQGIKLVDWTLMTVTAREASTVTCSFESGYRQPFSSRRSSRLQQLAYRVKPRLDSSTVRLVDRRSPSDPLPGYEVYSRPPGSETASELVGRTDWRGEVIVRRDPQRPVQVLYVRNGQQLLGKLPVVPGEQPLLVASLRNDDLRLEAEGFLLGVQDSLVDLVARRELLASRIRRAIEERALEQADQLLRELRKLETQDDFVRRVQQRKQTLSTVDAQVQQKIDELFAQTGAMMGKYLNQAQVDELSRALEAARQGGG
jgi:hypothetical protein